MKDRFSKTTLRNGVRVISENIPSVRSVTVGIWVHAGSRDETPDENGISHFIEHMFFKRTKTRTALQIAQSLETLGGSINAFTSREHTCFYARVLHKHLPQAMDVLGDILNNSLFTPGDLKKEKQVIMEEIKDVMDTPNDFIHDLFTAQMWKTSALGQPIMGTLKTVEEMNRRMVLDYIKRNYLGQNIVVAAAGYVSHQKLVEMVRKLFAWPRNNFSRIEGQPEHNGFSIKAYRHKSQQTQVCLGFPSISFVEEDRYPLMAANTVLSGGMSSRLFQTVREKAGFCYHIYSYQEFFRDTGIFCVYFGSDSKHTVPATNLVLKELKKIKKQKLTRTELNQIKEQLKGSLMLSQESTYNRMNRIARQELMLGQYIDLDETIRCIDRITATQICDVANRIFDNRYLTCSTLGPIKQKELETINWSKL